MKAFIIAWLAFLILMLTGAFMLAAHGNEFGSSTVTQSTNSTVATSTTFLGTPITVQATNSTWTIKIANSTSIVTIPSTAPPPQIRTVSDYGQLGLVLAVVLGAVIGLAVYASKKIKK